MGSAASSAVVFGCLIAGSSLTERSLAAQYDFLFTPSKVIYLQTGAEIVPSTQFDEQTLRKLLPDFQFERAEEEDQEVLYVYRSKDADGVGQGGINIYVGRDAKVVDFITGMAGTIDSVGATAGVPLTQVYRTGKAKCEAGLDYSCESDFSPFVSYVVDADKCPSSVAFPSYSIDKVLTTLAPCMTIYSILLSAMPF